MTARIVAVNYCSGCRRFLPAVEWEKKYGNTYGRCRRDDVELEDGTYEVWKVIPAHATVVRCWYWIQENKKEK